MVLEDGLYSITLNVNGVNHALSVPARRTLGDLLRYDLGLTGTKEACSVGVCGVCTVLLDGNVTASCITLAVQANGAHITTIEGIAAEGQLHPLQESFMRNGGFQCGICTSGQIVAAKALLDANPSPNEAEIRKWMMGNLCRCTVTIRLLNLSPKRFNKPTNSHARFLLPHSFQCL